MRNFFHYSELFEDKQRLFGIVQCQGVHGFCFEDFGTQSQMNTKQLRWHNTLVFISSTNQVVTIWVLNMLNKWDECQAISTTQTLWLMLNAKNTCNKI
jgi:hypothetical protein